MIGVLIAAHGTLATAAMELVEMLSGAKEAVRTITFEPGQSLETLIAAFTSALDDLASPEGTLILTDVKGGSPCNVATLMQKTRGKIQALHGVNIPMLLQVFDDRDDGLSLSALAASAVEIGALGIGLIQFEE